MKVQTQQRGAVTVIRPDGPLIAADAEAFRERLTDEIRQNLGRVVLDASAVPYVDSLGLESLLDISEEMARAGRMLKLCGVNETVRQVLDLTDLASRFEYFEDANAATRSFL